MKRAALVLASVAALSGIGAVLGPWWAERNRRQIEREAEAAAERLRG